MRARIISFLPGLGCCWGRAFEKVEARLASREVLVAFVSSSLPERWFKRTIPGREYLQLCRGMVEGLHFLWQRNAKMQDIIPSNVMWDREGEGCAESVFQACLCARGPSRVVQFS